MFIYVMNLKFHTSSAKYIIAYSSLLPVIYTLQNKNHIQHPASIFFFFKKKFQIDSNGNEDGI